MTKENIYTDGVILEEMEIEEMEQVEAPGFLLNG
jgi:hypothetical protein